MNAEGIPGGFLGNAGVLGRIWFPVIFRKKKPHVRTAILGPEMAAPLLWAPGIYWFSVKQKALHAHKIPLFWGGIWGFQGAVRALFCVWLPDALSSKRISKPYSEPIQTVLTTSPSRTWKQSKPYSICTRTKACFLSLFVGFTRKFC